MPYRTQSSQWPKTSSCLPKTEAFPVSFRYAWEACDGDYYPKHVKLQQQESSICTHESEHIITKKITKTLRREVLQSYQTTHDNIMPGFRMLAFKLWGGRVHPKTFESFLLSPKILFKFFELIHSFKNSTKKLSEFFSNKSENKLDNIWER